MAPLGLIDLSALTAFLVKKLNDAMAASPLFTPATKPTVTGLAPDTVRNDGGCQVTLYLFHVSPDPNYRNTPVTSKRPQIIPFQPMALTLHYLLTAFSKKSAELEQQAMSVALKTLYESPHFSTIVGGNHFTLTLQPDSTGELGQIWQSFAVAARLSTVYRVAVVFLEPPPTPASNQQVSSYNVTADPAQLPFVEQGSVVGTERRVTYRIPSSTTERSFVQSPASASAGQRLRLWGSHLGVAPSQEVYLLSADGSTETKVSPWIVANIDAGIDGAKGSRLTLQLPATVGTAPADTPAAGVYQLRAGTDGAPSYRSNATPFSIAPSITGPAPAASVVLTDVAGVFTLNGLGFTSSTTEVLLETIALTKSAGPLADGEFLVDAGLTSIQFRAPANLPPGDYAVRVRTNNVEADPAWWIHR